MLRLLRVILGGGWLLALCVSGPPAAAQTPSPLLNWQYSAGEVLAPLGGPIPDWRVVLGGGVDVEPLYEGAKRYRVLPSAVVDIRYKQVAFLSDGEGLGVNILHGPTYRAGLALSYDLGRDHHLERRLSGLGNVHAAPEAKLFAEYFFVPFVLTFDVRRGLGGHNGVIGDIGVYVPIPAAKNLYIFTGPSVTFADQRYMQAYFGITPAQAAHSQFPAFTAHAGLERAGWGLTAVYRLTPHWLLEGDVAWEYLQGDAGHSPIVELRSEWAGSANVLYRF